MTFNVKVKSEHRENSVDKLLYTATLYFNEHEYYINATKIIGEYSEKEIDKFSSDFMVIVRKFITEAFKNINWKNELKCFTHLICTYPDNGNRKSVELCLVTKEEGILKKYYIEFDIPCEKFNAVRFINDAESSIDKLFNKYEKKPNRTFEPTVQEIEYFSEAIKNDVIRKDIAEYKLTDNQKQVLQMMYHARNIDFISRGNHHDRGWIVALDITETGSIRNKVTVQQCCAQLVKKKLVKAKKDPFNKSINRYHITRTGVNLVDDIIFLEKKDEM